MKTPRHFIIAFLVGLLAPSVSSAQEVKIELNDDGMYEYQEVIQAEGLTADVLYNRAVEWIALNYTSANDVIQLQDKENHRIVAKGVFTTKNYGVKVYIFHTFQSQFREGRFRVTYNQLVYQGGVDAPKLPLEGRVPRRKRMLEKTQIMIQSSVESFIKALTTDEEDEW